MFVASICHDLHPFGECGLHLGTGSGARLSVFPSSAPRPRLPLVVVRGLPNALDVPGLAVIAILGGKPEVSLLLSGSTSYRANLATGSEAGWPYAISLLARACEIAGHGWP
jgi:hypothetical protein